MKITTSDYYSRSNTKLQAKVLCGMAAPFSPPESAWLLQNERS